MYKRQVLGSIRPSSAASSIQGSDPDPLVNEFGYKMDFKIPKFDGDYLKFPSWWDDFQALHKAKIPEATKFRILKDSLVDEPKQLIGSYFSTSENYEKAVRILKENYGDPNVLLGMFVTRLHALPCVTSDNIDSLSKLIHQFEQYYVEICNLIKQLSPGTDVENKVDIVSFFLSPILLSKVSNELQLRWVDLSLIHI